MADNNGWVKLHRKLLDNPIVMKDADHLAVWTYLLLCATHTEYPMLFKGKKIMLQSGQLITGRKSIAEKLCISESKVTRILNAFENEQQIEQQASNKNRLITVLNWDLYQILEQQNEQQVNNKRTTSEQQVNTNKNVKKDKNVKNERKTYSEHPALNDTILEFIAYRKGIKKPMTDNAVKLLLGKLDKMTSNANEQIEILNQSIVNGWIGVFPLKEEKKQPQQAKKNSFNNFHQRSYEADALERLALSTTPDYERVENNPELRKEAEELKRMLQETY